MWGSSLAGLGLRAVPRHRAPHPVELPARLARTGSSWLQARRPARDRAPPASRRGAESRLEPVPVGRGDGPPPARACAGAGEASAARPTSRAGTLGVATGHGAAGAAGARGVPASTVAGSRTSSAPGPRVTELRGPAQPDRDHEARGPGGCCIRRRRAETCSAARRAQRLEGRRQPQRRGRDAASSAVVRSRRAAMLVARGPARDAVGEMALDLDALRAAQRLVQIGVQLVFRNVPHGSLRCLLPVVRLHQPPPRPRQRGADRADREPGLRRDLGIAEPGVPQEQDLPVPRRQRVERLLHRGHLLVVLDRVVGRRRPPSAGRPDRP